MLPLCLSTSLLFPVLIIAAPSAWVFRRLGLGVWFGSYARRHAILVASQDSAMLLTICGMSCIGFLYHSGSLTGSLSGADHLMWSLLIYTSTTLSIQHRGSPRSSRQAEVLVSRSRTSILQRRAFLLLACNLEWASFGTTPNAESPSHYVLF